MEHSGVVNISEQPHDLISFYIKAGEKKSHAEESEGDWNTARSSFSPFLITGSVIITTVIFVKVASLITWMAKTEVLISMKKKSAKH